MPEAVWVALISAGFAGLFGVVMKLVDRKTEVVKVDVDKSRSEVERLVRSMEGMQVLSEEQRADNGVLRAENATLRADSAHKDEVIADLRLQLQEKDRDFIEEKATTIALGRLLDKQGREADG